MVIKVSWRLLETPTLLGSQHYSEIYYEVGSMPDTDWMIQHLKPSVKHFDPMSVIIEQVSIHKLVP